MKKKKTGKIKNNKGEREVMELGDFAIKVNSVEGHIGQSLVISLHVRSLTARLGLIGQR